MKQNVIFGLVWAGWAYEVSTGPDKIKTSLGWAV